VTSILISFSSARLNTSYGKESRPDQPQVETMHSNASVQLIQRRVCIKLYTSWWCRVTLSIRSAISLTSGFVSCLKTMISSCRLHMVSHEVPIVLAL
jgi:hypothetical protein